MNGTRCIQIKYDGGSTSVLLPAWVEQATRPNQRKLLRLMAEHATDCPENKESVRDLEEVIDEMLADAEREAKALTAEAEAAPDKSAAQAEARRANNSLKRLKDLKADFTQAMEKYNPTRKV